MLLHSQESLDFLIDDFYYVVGDCLSLEVIEELLDLFLLLILLVSEVLLKTLINLLQLLLSLDLIRPEVVLFFKFVPDFKLVDEISK
jgi:hypothetical protein